MTRRVRKVALDRKLRDALIAAGYEEQIAQLESNEVDRWTIDFLVDDLQFYGKGDLARALLEWSEAAFRSPQTVYRRKARGRFERRAAGALDYGRTPAARFISSLESNADNFYYFLNARVTGDHDGASEAELKQYAQKSIANIRKSLADMEAAVAEMENEIEEVFA